MKMLCRFSLSVFLFLSLNLYAYVGSVDNPVDQKVKTCDYGTEHRASKSAGSREVNPENVLANLNLLEESDSDGGSEDSPGRGGALQ